MTLITPPFLPTPVSNRCLVSPPHQGREEENALSDQLRRIVALRSRLEDMALRLEALEGTSRALRAQGIQGLCPLHHHLRQGGPTLPTPLSGEGRVDGSPFTAADGP